MNGGKAFIAVLCIKNEIQWTTFARRWPPSERRTRRRSGWPRSASRPPSSRTGPTGPPSKMIFTLMDVQMLLGAMGAQRQKRTGEIL